MNFVKHLVSKFCSPEYSYSESLETLPTLSQRRYCMPPRPEKPKKTKSHFTNLEKVVELCKQLPDESKGRKVSVGPLGDKKLLLIDLDRTIILYYNHSFLIRPYLLDFLRTVSEFYVIYIFTAATDRYLQEMLRLIGLQGAGAEYISGYLSRENCSKVKWHQKRTLYVKDISIITDVDPSKIVIVDDLPVSFCLTPQNGILLPPFLGSPYDTNLLRLTSALMYIKDSDDVREYIVRKSRANQSKSSKTSVSTKESLSPPKDDESKKKKIGFVKRHQSY